MIVPAAPCHAAAWSTMRAALWPDATADEHRAEIAELLNASGAGAAAFIAFDGDRAIGFAEAALRRDYVNGCDTSPVAFLDGIFVVPEARRRGVAQALLAAVAGWGRVHDCTELASDSELANAAGRAWHGAAGFVETERVVFYKMPL